MRDAWRSRGGMGRRRGGSKEGKNGRGNKDKSEGLEKGYYRNDVEWYLYDISTDSSGQGNQSFTGYLHQYSTYLIQR